MHALRTHTHAAAQFDYPSAAYSVAPTAVTVYYPCRSTRTVALHGYSVTVPHYWTLFCLYLPTVPVTYLTDYTTTRVTVWFFTRCCHAHARILPLPPPSPAWFGSPLRTPLLGSYCWTNSQALRADVCLPPPRYGLDLSRYLIHYLPQRTVLRLHTCTFTGYAPLPAGSFTCTTARGCSMPRDHMITL